MRAMWPKNGLRTSLAAFDVVGLMDVRRGRPGPRATSATVSAERAKIIGERYVHMVLSLQNPKGMVERCAPTINQARAACGMVACGCMRWYALWSCDMLRAVVALPGSAMELSC